MDELPSQYFYIINLEDVEYLKTVFADKDIHDSFSEIDKEKIKTAIQTMKTQRGAPKPIDFRLIRNDHYLNLLINHFSGGIKQKIVG